ncbi:MAG: ATP-binding cassette domain-containing protein [Actinobacteria bacterium]|nr:ATP-binding cassette domain-containing protein [Actinomycetota bacterium]MBW3646259.1 ATP-binding cassette domain-containing protein [Actinomycetota bacterium]
MSEPLIRLVDVRKTFVLRERAGRIRRTKREVTAVDGISLDVPAGQICGYIGPNGAGKSTTVKILTGILTATSGTVRVAGLDPRTRRVELTRRVGVVFGQRTQLWWDLPLADSFELLRHVYRRDLADHRSRLSTLVEVLDLGAFLATPVRQLSLGQRMRGDLAAALLHAPEVLYLDEPTIGLDVVSKARVGEFLRRVNAEQGVTVLLTTHDLADVERLCDRLVVIDRGRVISDGTVAQIKQTYGRTRTLLVDFVEPQAPVTLQGITAVRVDGPRQWLSFDRTTSAAQLIAQVMQEASVRDLSIEEPHIDDVVRQVYGLAREQLLAAEGEDRA